MTIRQLEISYQTKAPLRQDILNDVLAEGDRCRKRLKWLPTQDSRIEVGYLRRSQEVEFYVFLDRDCEGAIFLRTDLDEELSLTMEQRKHVKLFFKGSTIAVPHVYMRKLKGLGYASFIYTKALTSGITLMTDEHTKDAAGLWESLGKKFNLFYYDPYAGGLSERSKRSLKVLSKLDPRQLSKSA